MPDNIGRQDTSLLVHNPEPSTPRGRRRHNNRDESGQKAAKRAWALGRDYCPPRQKPSRQATA